MKRDITLKYCLTLLIPLLLVTEGRAFMPGDQERTAPNWSPPPRLNQIPNNSYLLSIDESPDSRRSERIRKRIFNPKANNPIRQKYEDMNREFDFRSQYHQAGRQEQLAQQKKISDFNKYYLRYMLSFHFTEELNEAEKRSEEVRTFKQVNDQVQRLAQGAMNVEITQETKIGTKADIPEQQGRVWMTSPVINGAVDMQIGKKSMFSQSALLLPTNPADATDEKVRVSLTRDLPFVDVQSGVSYGATSNQLVTSMSKQVTDHVVCTLANVRKISEASDEQTLRVSYGVSF